MPAQKKEIVDVVGKDLHDDFEKVKEKIRETRDALSQTAVDAKGRAQEVLNDSVGDVKETYDDLEQRVATYVKKNPFKSLGFGILAGMVISSFLRKR